MDLRSRWDWYEATFDGADDGRVALALAVALGGTIAPGKGRNGYSHADVIERDEEVLATVYGRSARAGEIHVSVSGDSCDEVVPLVRSLWPDHRVSRADSSIDFAADFEQLDARTLTFAESRGLSFRMVTNSEGGATRYVGSPRSETMLRVYKKSEQLRALHPEAAASIPDGIVRCELQTRPGKREAKEAVAQMSSDDLWGLSEWSRLFAATLLDFDAPRTSTHFRRPSDWRRALHYIAIQYGPMVERRADVVGVEQARAELLAALGLG